MCLKSNIVGLQIQANPIDICDNYKPVGQDSNTNQDPIAIDTCHTVMKHICAKQLYDQGCINMRTDSNGLKKPSWFDSPKCTSYNLNTDKTGTNFYSGTPDCTCINSMSGYTLNNKPKPSNYENPYQLNSTDTNYLNSQGDTPYALNVWNFNSIAPNFYNPSQPGNNNNGTPGEDDPDCVNSMKLPYGAYMLPLYYITTVGTVCKNIMTFNGINADEFLAYNINQTNNCGRAISNPNLRASSLALASTAATTATATTPPATATTPPATATTPPATATTPPATATATTATATTTTPPATATARTTTTTTATATATATTPATTTTTAATTPATTTTSPATATTPARTTTTATATATTPATTTTTAATTPTATTTTPATTTTSSTTTTSIMSTTNIIIIVSVIGSVIILSIIIYFIFRKKNIIVKK